ncbi:10933_t:CDS:2 [Racocetra fulgida]|uniref:10933_t:CDS:1 n=1 Tax=Racocetra fulgida TaxID=60492 RepID=A0A9N8ZHD1_9GLOM|nr:10933_t:CDS:2 [Racocetra fulgida]
MSNSSTEVAIQEGAQSSSFDVEADDSSDPISIPSSLKEKKVCIKTSNITNESIQCADSLSDEYSNSDEANDERNFDAALTSLLEAKETISSNLTEDSSLQSINEVVTMKFKYSGLLITNNVQENTSNIVNELTVEDKCNECDEMEDIQMS